MKKTKRTAQVPLAILIVFACLLLCLLAGLSAYALLTERTGVYGDLYLYYGLTRFQFLSYTTVIFIGNLFFGITITKTLVFGDQSRLNRTFLGFLGFVLLMVGSAIYLHTRFTPKG